ncbi:hypothetical protein [Blastococcus deserti]|uniref:PH (Pleckstrin Homology) domain-containing protein n=1 Tax=Blastococcus deserti TaxID=2259033 RepID=A0ABW4XE07_9ACTN
MTGTGTRAGSIARRLAVAEFRQYGALRRWLLRRPDIPAGATGFSYVGIVLPVLWAFIVVSALEVVIVHIVVPWPTVRLVLDVLGVWGVLWMLGLTASLTVTPHLLDDEGLRIRNGVMTDVPVPWEAVTAVAVRQRARERSRAVQVDRDGDGVVLNVVAGGQTNVDITLRHPLEVELSSGSERITAIRLHADDPRGLVAAARACLPRSQGATPPPA